LAVFITFGVLGIVGSLIFLSLRVPVGVVPSAEGEEKDSEAKTKQPSMMEKLRRSFRIVLSKRMLWMVIPLIFSGTNSALFWGTFPALIGPPRLSYVMALLAGFDSVSSFICGKLSDSIGRIPILLFGMFCLNTSNILVMYGSTFIRDDDGIAFGIGEGMSNLEYRVPPNAMTMFWLAAIGYGLYDSAMQTQIYSTFGLIFPDDPPAAFGAATFILSAVSGVWFVAAAYASVMTMGILSCCLSVLFIVVIYLINRFVAPLLPEVVVPKPGGKRVSPSEKLTESLLDHSSPGVSEETGEELASTSATEMN